MPIPFETNVLQYNTITATNQKSTEAVILGTCSCFWTHVTNMVERTAAGSSTLGRLGLTRLRVNWRVFSRVCPELESIRTLHMQRTIHRKTYVTGETTLLKSNPSQRAYLVMNHPSPVLGNCHRLAERGSSIYLLGGSLT